MTAAEPARLQPLACAGEPVSAAETVERLGLWARPAAPGLARPRVLLNMIESADGAATLAERSGGLSGPGDRALFHALRAASDGVLVGAGTVRKERYGRLIPNAQVRALRAERGLAQEPVACIVTRKLDLDESVPLLAEPSARVVIVTPSKGTIAAAVAAQVEYVRCEAAGREDLKRAMRLLRERHGIELLLCEGGPHLARDLIASGMLDELYLSLAPMLEGGDGGGEPGLRILAGEPLQPPARLQLLGALSTDSTLLLRYAVFSGERVARETAVSSSLAS